VSSNDAEDWTLHVTAQRNRIVAYQYEIEKLQARGRSDDAPRIIKLRRMIARIERDMRQGVLTPTR
jgi:hypothetical protein